jgi:hypothetical protein
MIINSHSLISELKNYVASKDSFAAKIGETDDLIAAALLSTRMIQELGDFHFDLESQIRDHEDIILPLPFYAIM